MDKMYDKIKQALVRWYVLKKECHVHRQVTCQPESDGTNRSEKTLVIIPCDPDGVIGSRGDEAMIVASIQHFQKNNGEESSIYVVCSNEFHNPGWPTIETRYNVKLLRIWHGPFPNGVVAREIEKLHPSHINILGADCMDGYYSPNISFELLSLYVIFQKRGYKTSLLGFSYNNHPHPLSNRLFKKIGKEVVFNLRDSQSLRNFSHFTSIPQIRLVADSAFMLMPNKESEARKRYEGVITALRNQGISTVLAFNFHPMLSKNQTDEELSIYTHKLAEHLNRLLRRNPKLAIVLLPHDDRARISDNFVLQEIYNYLSQENGERVVYDSRVYRSEDIKGVVDLFDGVISSRMHLAIAAMGMEVPVMTVEYQGKFRGLFKHFKYPERFLLTPEEFTSNIFEQRTEDFIEQLPDLKKCLQQALPEVMKLSSLNFQ